LRKRSGSYHPVEILDELERASLVGNIEVVSRIVPIKARFAFGELKEWEVSRNKTAESLCARGNIPQVDKWIRDLRGVLQLRVTDKTARGIVQ
jgi:hypothetical protein